MEQLTQHREEDEFYDKGYMLFDLNAVEDVIDRIIIHHIYGKRYI